MSDEDLSTPESTKLAILRSLCANSREELEIAQENYQQTELNDLEFQGVESKLLELIKKCYLAGGPPTTGLLKSQAARDNDLSFKLYIEGVENTSPLLGSNYTITLQNYLEDKGVEKLNDALQATAQIARDGRELRGAKLQKGLTDAIAHIQDATSKIQRFIDPSSKSMSNEEAVEFLTEEYIKRRNQPTLAYGVATGISCLDDVTKGGQPGEMWVVGGFTSHGKCQNPLSEVLDFDTGDFKTLKDLMEEGKLPLVASYNEEKQEVVLKRMSKIWEGEKRREVKFNVGGVQQRVGDTHPFLTPQGWVKAGDLKELDLVAVPRRIPWEAQEKDLNQAEILGLMLGDGSYTEYTPTFSTYTQEGEERIEKLLTALNQPYSKSGYKKDERLFRLLKKPKYLDDIQYSRAWEKKIPKDWFLAGNETAKALLKGLWQSDGWVSYGKAGLEIGYSCTSHILIKQIRILLMRLGISSSEQKPKYGKYKKQDGEVKICKMVYRLRVKSMKDFYTLISHDVPKVKLSENLYKNESSFPKSLLPKDWVDSCYKKELQLREGKKLSRKDRNSREHRWAYKLTHNSTGSLRLSTVQEALEKVPDVRIQKIIDEIDWSHIYNWEISEEEKPTLDFEVPETHNAMVDFSIQHNSSFCLNSARYAAVEGGMNILVFTLEMSKEQVWRILACGHSANPRFNGRKPLSYSNQKSGTFDSEDENFYLNEVLPDLINPLYGKIIVETPSGTAATMNSIRAKAEAINRTTPLDMILIDYVGLVSGEKKVDHKQMLNENLKMAKQMAIEFDRGRGIFLMTPHQINRAGFDRASKAMGVYDIAALSDANEAERSSDVVITIYQDRPHQQKKEAVITMLKNRDGAILEPWNIYSPPEHRYMADLDINDVSSLEIRTLDA